MTDDEIRAHMESGRESWRRGDPMPATPATDDITPEAMQWVGFIEARAHDWFKRRAMAIYPDTVEPRP